MNDPCVGEPSEALFKKVGALTALSLCLRATPGAYALLLGSGVSRAASIPTGWQILLELIRRVAHLEGHDPGLKPDEWYRQAFGEPPDYSALLARVAETPAERSQLIREFIEPTDEQRDLGIKVPTEAHRAITELVGEGHVRVIITTNFDRLIEIALADLGIVPTVITPDDPEGSWLPLVHNRCTLVKLHGDYIDTTILNTAGELEKYSAKINRLLRQTVSEYGLIISGWSGEWDTALVRAVNTTTGSPFSTYWIAHSEPKVDAQRVIEARKARVVTHMDAETFFPQLAENVRALADLAKPELLSVQMAQASMKRYILDPTRQVRLDDLVRAETERAFRAIVEQPRESYTLVMTRESLRERLDGYVRTTAVLRALVAIGCYWGTEQHESHWISCLQRLGNLPSLGFGSAENPWSVLRYFPALLVLYTGGISAVAHERYHTLAALLAKPRIRRYEEEPAAPMLLALPGALTDDRAGMDNRGVQKLYDDQDPRRRVPISSYLWDSSEIWAPLRDVVPDAKRFEDCFDRFEYYRGLVYLDLYRKHHGNHARWSPLGYFALRGYGRPARQQLLSDIEGEINAAIGPELENWPFVQLGLFERDFQVLSETMTLFNQHVLCFSPV